MGSLEQVFKTLAWDALVESAIDAVFKAIPLLAWGPIGWVVAFAIRYVAGILYTNLELTIKLEAIQFKNEQAATAFKLAAIRLIGMKPDSPEYKEARDAEKKAFAEYLRFNIA